ncbi:MAG: hypothetical protein SVK08_01980 [Halobacteriota archaeon]|nr:hypothetical protein [Halobacteriota archaeon]
MIKVSVQVERDDLIKIASALNKVNNVVYNAARRLPYRMAIEYSDMLRQNIQQGTFSGMYKPYNKKYAEYKQLMVGHLRFWVLFGDVLASISVFKHGNGFMGGIPAGKMDRGEKGWYGTGKPSSIAAYARANEFGEGPTPARPVFRPTFAQFKRDRLGKFEKETYEDIRRWWR